MILIVFLCRASLQLLHPVMQVALRVLLTRCVYLLHRLAFLHSASHSATGGPGTAAQVTGAEDAAVVLVVGTFATCGGRRGDPTRGGEGTGLLGSWWDQSQLLRCCLLLVRAWLAQAPSIFALH